ncbi:hypothetical protein GEV33_007136 [Tenebrio molitor]|uniref:Uncharacterized protein n=1 Tax=Tenebrio molitor TaxID=7067 RepID=A0A8J6HJ91_TENMO|nr:hypothetical protein GEV33_007136 [Tenebrio molitor]
MIRILENSNEWIKFPSTNDSINEAKQQWQERTFQNGLTAPDFRYRPRQFGERRGKYIKVEQTPFKRFSTSSGQRLRPIRVVRQELANPWRRTESAGKPGLISPHCWAGVIPKDPTREQDLTPDRPWLRNPSPGATSYLEGSRGGRTPRTFRGYGRRDRPAAEEGLGGPSSSSLFQGLFLDFKPQARLSLYIDDSVSPAAASRLDFN